MLGWTQLIVNKNEVLYVYSDKEKATQGDTRECRSTGTQGRHTPPSNNLHLHKSLTQDKGGAALTVSLQLSHQPTHHGILDQKHFPKVRSGPMEPPEEHRNARLTPL